MSEMQWSADRYALRGVGSRMCTYVRDGRDSADSLTAPVVLACYGETAREALSRAHLAAASPDLKGALEELLACTVSGDELLLLVTASGATSKEQKKFIPRADRIAAAIQRGYASLDRAKCEVSTDE